MKTFAGQTAAWRPQYFGEPEGTGTGTPLSMKVAKNYRNSSNLVPAFLLRAGAPIDPTTDVAACTEKESVALWLPELIEHYDGSSGATKLCGTMRVFTDVLGEDHANIVLLCATINKMKAADDALSGDEVETARNLGRAEGGATVTIWMIQT